MPAIRIKVPCAEFGRSFALGQYVADLMTLQSVAMVLSGLAEYEPPSSGNGFSMPHEGLVPVTSVMMAAPATYGLNQTSNRIYDFAGQRLVWDGEKISPGSAAMGLYVIGQRLLGQVVTARLAGGAASGYQWYRDGVAIGGATAAAYTLVAADVLPGVVVSCRATGFVPEGKLLY